MTVILANTRTPELKNTDHFNPRLMPQLNDKTLPINVYFPTNKHACLKPVYLKRFINIPSYEKNVGCPLIYARNTRHKFVFDLPSARSAFLSIIQTKNIYNPINHVITESLVQ